MLLALGAKIEIKGIEIRIANTGRAVHSADRVKTGCGSDLCVHKNAVYLLFILSL